MFMDAADSLFVHAKARVITHTARKHKKIRGDKSEPRTRSRGEPEMEVARRCFGGV